MKRFPFKWTAAFAVWFTATVAIVAANIYYSIPTPETIKGCFVTKMHNVELCPKKGNYVPLSQISPHVRNAILVSEDTGFYSHKGFEFEELKESLRVNWERGTFARGGSTITQQLARNMFLSSEKSLLRKVKEAIITYKLEETLSKNEILERYLNVVEFGKDIYGIKAAARHYFNKSPADLSVLESSYLAFLLPSPVKYSSSYYKGSLTKFGFKRMHQILFRLFSYQRISPEEYEVSKSMIKAFPWRPSDLAAVESPSAAEAAIEDALAREPIEGDETGEPMEQYEDVSEDEFKADTSSPLSISDPEEI
ncbi:MAG TPA: biosynthetic peptidoglycan transglycosylase [Bdellovibrionales bacterium]|nr:biosynthetic peptidoglycan transglycosylase [Bdellovibrionales bacterium]